MVLVLRRRRDRALKRSRVRQSAGRQRRRARAALNAVGGFDIREVPPETLADQVRAAIGEGATRVLVAGGDGSIEPRPVRSSEPASSWRFFRPER
jgi:hypothetical protein